MHIVLEYHYAYADFNPQVSGSNDTLFHGIKCDRIEYVYIYGQISRRALVSDTAFVGNTYTCTVIVLYGNMVFAMILRL